MKLNIPRELYVVRAQGSRQKVLRDETPVGEGAAGFIFKSNDCVGEVLKIYKEGVDLLTYKEKIAAMIQADPGIGAIEGNGRSYVQLAWPSAVVESRNRKFLGFAMPEVNFAKSVSVEKMMQKSMRRNSALPEAYRHRVHIAANLATMVSDLHKLGHFMIDMKPINMRVYPDNMYVGIIDCDGFSIRGASRRYAAEQFTAEYIAPEAHGKDPPALGEAQDLFALAVIIFRLMNNGLHPFQGLIGAHLEEPGDIQERIYKLLYAYGLRDYSIQKPSIQSIHEFFEKGTRQLFDRAFTSVDRPKAAEWRDHLRSLVSQSNPILVPCRVNNDHSHFSLGCGLCHTESGGKVRPKSKAAGVGKTSPQKNAHTVSQTVAQQSNTVVGHKSIQHTAQPRPYPPAIVTAPPSPILWIQRFLIHVFVGIVCVVVIGLALTDLPKRGSASIQDEAPTSGLAGPKPEQAPQLPCVAVAQYRCIPVSEPEVGVDQSDSIVLGTASNIQPVDVEDPGITQVDAVNGSLGIEDATTSQTPIQQIFEPPVLESKRSQLSYPRAAERRNLTGTVVLTVFTDIDGSVLNIVVKKSSGHPILDNAAAKHVRESWQYRPQTRNGIPEKGNVDTPPIRFVIK